VSSSILSCQQAKALYASPFFFILRFTSTLYQDKLIEVTDEAITFHRYYFPFGARRVPFDQIESIQVQPGPTGDNWRLWGSSNFKIWFPLDMKRPRRESIFIASLRGTSRQIGFTVEDSRKVETLFRDRGLIP
jgi:hypothetical protein